MEWRGREWSGGEGREGEGMAGQGRVPDCLGGLSRVGISSRSTRPWNGQPPSNYTNSDSPLHPEQGSSRVREPVNCRQTFLCGQLSLQHCYAGFYYECH